MKKLIVWLCAMCVCVTALQAQIATKVSFYCLSVSLPDVTKPEFGTARDNLLNRLKLGLSPVTGTRVNNVLGLELRKSAEAGDLTVSSGALWRSVFNPLSPFATQTGQRWYFPVTMVAEDGSLTLGRCSYIVSCGVGLLSNASDLAGLNYSVSRIGVQKGPDGKLWTPDDIFLQNGEVGTTLVDAIIFIGARIGANITNGNDLANLNAAIGPAGTFANCTYRFQTESGIVSHEYHSWIYPQGGIPASETKVQDFRMPKGIVFSLVRPMGSVPVSLHSSRNADGPWNLVTDSAMEGTSGYVEFTRNPTNDMGFFRIGAVPLMDARPRIPSPIGNSPFKAVPVVSAAGSEADQDS